MKTMPFLIKNLNDLNCTAPKTVCFRLLGSILVWLGKVMRIKVKKRRQAKILELIKNLDVETQEELQQLLRENGFEVTQATISRDIKELRLVKELSTGGRYVYSTGKKNHSDSVYARASGIFADSVISVESAVNMVCIKCFAGMAGAACAAVDSVQWNEVLGTIAGDDTIFVLCKTEQAAKLFTSNLEKSLNVKNA